MITLSSLEGVQVPHPWHGKSAQYCISQQSELIPPGQTQTQILTRRLNGVICWERELDSLQAFSTDVVRRVQLQMRKNKGKEKCCFCLARQEYENNIAWGSYPANYANLCGNKLDLRMILMIAVFTHGVTHNLIYAWYACKRIVLRIYASRNVIYTWYLGLHHLRVNHVYARYIEYPVNNYLRMIPRIYPGFTRVWIPFTHFNTIYA